MVVSSLVGLRESMKLFAGPAEAKNAESRERGWPDFARFRCSACHHDLRAAAGAPRRAQIHRRGSAPGRPVAPEWPSVLLQLGIVAAGTARAEAQSKRLNEELTAFRQSLEAARHHSAPRIALFGQRPWPQALIHLLAVDSQIIFDETVARQLLKKLCEIARATPPDYDSARQITAAFSIIYHEVTPEQKRDAVIERAARRPRRSALFGSRARRSGHPPSRSCFWISSRLQPSLTLSIFSRRLKGSQAVSGGGGHGGGSPLRSGMPLILPHASTSA